MQPIQVGLLFLAAAVTAAAPQSAPEDLMSISEPLNHAWHIPTANDLHLMTSNDSYISDEEGIPLFISPNPTINERSPGTDQPPPPKTTTYRTTSAKVGNGNPHQNPYHQQQTQTLPCGPGGSCSVSISKSHSISWTASEGVQLGWISGGFSVSKSYTQGSSETCDGNAGGKVCIWFTYGVTAYTVSSTTCKYVNGVKIPNSCKHHGKRILYSPNHCQRGQPYCVRGSACRKENAGYYQKKNAKAGGPPC